MIKPIKYVCFKVVYTYLAFAGVINKLDSFFINNNVVLIWNKHY